MSSLATLIYAPRSIGLFANASKDPLPFFRQVYTRTSQIARLSILVSTVANAVCYYRTKDTRFIYSTALSFVSFPFTILFMMPVNNELLAMDKEGANYDRKQVYQRVVKWNKLQYVRTLSGAAAFLINILYR
ncbi:hypothetical protein MBANPS3_002203 [Mucor bainieri]